MAELEDPVQLETMEATEAMAATAAVEATEAMAVENNPVAEVGHDVPHRHHSFV